jgi:hypothetical protein
MFSAETLKKIADVLHISDFEAKLKSEKEEVLEVPALFTDDEKTTFGNNRFNEGKKAATEIAVKDLKTKHGLEFEGKTLDAALEAFAAKKLEEAKLPSDEKVKKLSDEKIELQTKLQKAMQEGEALKADYEGKMFQTSIRSQVLMSIPDKTIVPKEDLIDLFMNRHRVAMEDGSTVIYKGNEKLQDKVMNPISLKDAVLQFAESYIDKKGMGGGDAGGGGAVPKFKTGSQHFEYCQTNKINPMSKEGLELLNKNKDAEFDPNK